MKIGTFSGEHRWLSNFYPCSVVLEGVTFPSVEHAYQASKTDSVSMRSAFLSLTAGEAKKRGRALALRPGWETMKQLVMLDLLRQKFAYPDLSLKLIATGSALLEEGNRWGDRYWGVVDGSGSNHLGRLIMQVRKELCTHGVQA